MQKYTIVDLNGMTEEQLKEVASQLEITKMASEKKEVIYQTKIWLQLLPSPYSLMLPNRL